MNLREIECDARNYAGKPRSQENSRELRRKSQRHQLRMCFIECPQLSQLFRVFDADRVITANHNALNKRASYRRGFALWEPRLETLPFLKEQLNSPVQKRMEGEISDQRWTTLLTSSGVYQRDN